MRLLTRFARFSVVVIGGGLLLTGGCLSSPRDYSSPPITIIIVGENGAPLSNVEVSRHWYDSDCLTKGSETNITDITGTAKFQKIPANVGLFTGAWRKAHDNLAPRGSSSGTSTYVLIRFAGIYDVVPKDRPLHKMKYGDPSYAHYEDQDGVLFHTSTDNRSNTVTVLTFPDKSKTIDYVLSAKSQIQ